MRGEPSEQIHLVCEVYGEHIEHWVSTFIKYCGYFRVSLNDSRLYHSFDVYVC